MRRYISRNEALVLYSRDKYGRTASLTAHKILPGETASSEVTKPILQNNFEPNGPYTLNLSA